MATKGKSYGGRRSPIGEERDRVIVYLSPAEKQQLQVAADRCRMSVSAFVASAALRSLVASAAADNRKKADNAMRLFDGVFPGPANNYDNRPMRRDEPLFDEAALKIARGVMDDVLSQHIDLDSEDWHRLSHEIAKEVDSQGRWLLIGAVARRVARIYRHAEWDELSHDMQDSIRHDACILLGINPKTVTWGGAFTSPSASTLPTPAQRADEMAQMLIENLRRHVAEKYPKGPLAPHSEQRPKK